MNTTREIIATPTAMATATWSSRRSSSSEDDSGKDKRHGIIRRIHKTLVAAAAAAAAAAVRQVALGKNRYRAVLKGLLATELALKRS